MSAEVLRQAAALMRERAEAATPSPWSCDERSGVNDLHFGQVSLPVLRPLGTYGPNVGNTRHIASWHPAVALAVADWLEATAREFDAAGNPDLTNHPLDGRRSAGLAVARAYLGGA